MNIKCFISHSWHKEEDHSWCADEHAFAIKLADALQMHDIQKGWVDEREIHPGEYIEDRIREGILACDVFLFVMSPMAVASKWCRLELEEALTQRSETGIQIIPLLLKSIEKNHPILEKLEGLLYIDFNDEAKFERALEKLLTGIKKAYLVRATVLEVFDSDNEIRFVAAQKLGRLKNRFTVPILARRLDPEIEPDPTVRYWLAFALGQIGGDEACAALRTAEARETELFAKEGITEGLQAIGCSAQ